MAANDIETPVDLDKPAGDPWSDHYRPYSDTPFADNLRYAIALVRRNLKLIGIVVAAAFVLAVVITMLDTPRYTATSSVQINDQSEQVLGSDIEQQGPVINSWDVDRYLATQLDILRSKGLSARVAQKLEMPKNERFFAAMEAQPPEGASERVVRERILGLLDSNLNANLPRDSRIVRIGFTSADPEISALVANTYAEEYIQSNLQRRFDSSSYARKFVSEQLEEARARLESSERELNEYARGAGLIRSRDIGSESGKNGSGGSVTASSLMQLNEAANAAQARRLAAEARWKVESEAPLLASQAVLQNPTVQNLMTQRSEIEGELAVARDRYYPAHPTVIRLEAQRTGLNGQIDRIAKEIRNSIRSEYVAARQAEQRLQNQVNRLKGATLAEQDRAVRYNTLAREADTNRSLYEGLLQRYRELNAAAGITASNLAIIDEADVPLHPSSPSLFKNLAIGLLAGIGLAGLAVFIRDQLDDRIRVPEDVEEKVRLNLLGVIPRSAQGEIASEIADPKSAVAEAYNSLRNSLLYATRGGLPGITLITSADSSEGKSTTSFAIASGLARMGKKVVLIDADLRRPSIHHVADAPDNKRGLSDLLISSDPAMSAAKQSNVENLSVVPAGPIPPSASELLTSPRMAEILKELETAFDAVIIDSPPVLGLADAPTLAALADGVVFIIESEASRRGKIKAALRRLRAVQPALLGAVLTKFDPHKAGNDYSVYYGQDYYRYAPQVAAPA